MRKAPIPMLAVIAAITAIVAMACAPMARPPATTGNGGGTPSTTPPAPAPPPEPPPTVPPEPTPQDTEKRWTISPAHFGDDGVSILGDYSNRSEPYAWDRISAGKVRVSIGGKALPFTSTTYQPAFESDLDGAEWTVAAEVRAGAVVLVLTATDQRRDADRVESVTITNAGYGYLSVPTVTFSAPQTAGVTATGVAVRESGVRSVLLVSRGSGYTAPPTVTFTGGTGTGASATATLRASGEVDSVTITNPGTGYGQSGQPTVVFSAPASGTTASGQAFPSLGVESVTITNGGSGYTAPPSVGFAAGTGADAAGTAVLARTGNSLHQNLYWGRQTLYGKQLLVQVVDD